MRHIEQGHNNCGQTCLAMISDMSIEFVSKFLKKKCGTGAKDYINYLEEYDFRIINKKFKRCTWDTEFPLLCIIKCHNMPKTSYTHVIVYLNGMFHDPILDRGLDFELYKVTMDKRLRPTSYMEIEKL